MENNVEKRAVDLQPAIVVNKSQFPEPVHEEAAPGTWLCRSSPKQRCLYF